MLIKEAMMFTQAGKFERGDVYVKNGVIQRIGHFDGKADIDASGLSLFPGLVDIHTHGAVGADTCDATRKALSEMSEFYARNGVTSFCATTMTYGEEKLTAVCENVRDFDREGAARVIGINMEGPHLSSGKKGAQSAHHLCDPDIGMFHRLNRASGGKIRLVDVAPELDGAMDFIAEVSKSCTVSLAHTQADYDTAMRAFEQGASHVTHLFNAMPPFLHRDPGVVGAAIDAGVNVELICDGIHIHPAVVRAVFKLFAGHVCLVSDSIRCTGLPDGEYELGGQPVRVRSGRATLYDGTLAGSSISLIEGVRNAVKFGVPLADAVNAASATPAKAVGLYGEIGGIAVGKRADMFLADEHLNIVDVIAGGVLARR